MAVRQQLPQDALHIENCTRFCAEVEALIRENDKKADEREAEHGCKTSRLGYVDAVLIIADRRKIEPDLAASYLSPTIKEKMGREWQDRHMILRRNRLPF
jgi:hypothetical protein